MTPAEVARAHALLERIEAIREMLRAPDDGKNALFSFGEYDESGGSSDGRWFVLEPDEAKRLARQLFEEAAAELQRLGVNVPPLGAR